jgi:purine-nucleoside phosphorylase
MENTQQRVSEAVQGLLGSFPGWQGPRALVQLGAGFEAEGLFDAELGQVGMAELGLVSARPSCAGSPLRLRLGRVGASQVLVVEGHRYYYEGGGALETVFPVVVAARAGVRDIVLVEPGLGLHEHLKVGTWMAATDVINAMGICPAAGLLDLIPDPFLDLSDALSQSLNAEIINAAAQVGLDSRVGVYQATCGPQFDTPAEAEVARRHGADMLGHGIVPETVVAALLGCRVSACVLVAGTAASYGGRRLRQTDLMDAARFCSPTIMRALRCAFSAPG